jgi:hypothetical protein
MRIIDAREQTCPEHGRFTNKLYEEHEGGGPPQRWWGGCEEGPCGRGKTERAEHAPQDPPQP